MNSTQRNIDSIRLKEWLLEINILEDEVFQKLKENQLTPDIILACEKVDIVNLCEELKFSFHVQLNLLTALNKTKKEHNKEGNNNTELVEEVEEEIEKNRSKEQTSQFCFYSEEDDVAFAWTLQLEEYELNDANLSTSIQEFEQTQLEHEPDLELNHTQLYDTYYDSRSSTPSYLSSRRTFHRRSSLQVDKEPLNETIEPDNKDSETKPKINMILKNWMPDKFEKLGWIEEFNDIIETYMREKWKEWKVLTGHSGSVWGVKLSPNSRTIVSCSWDSTIRIWDVKSGRQMHKLEGHSLGVSGVKFSADGNTIMSWSDDKTVRLWDVTSGKQIRKLVGHTAGILGAQFSPDRRTILSYSKDKTIRLWDIRSGLEINKFENLDHVFAMKFSKDGHIILLQAKKETIRLWDVTTSREIQSYNQLHVDNIIGAEFSSNGDKIVMFSRNNITFVFSATSNGQVQTYRGHIGAVNGVQLSQDERFIVSCSDDKTIRLWDVQSGREMEKLKGHLGGVNEAQLSPDGRFIVSCSKDKSIRLWM